MFVGFDYGSANCAIGVMQGEEVSLVPLNGDAKYLTSTLYAMDRDLIAEAVLKQLPKDQQAQYTHLRSAQLSKAAFARRELDLLPHEPAVFVGDAAVEAYLEMPDEGFYVRSPKSFLGATGLRENQIALFEDIVTLMMMHIKSAAEKSMAATNGKITHAVIGRPVNFQGIGGEQSNQQAEAILTLAANRAGFVDVDFLFEPLAAGMDYEASLDEDVTVLVVDVGGGTTDCSMVKMGPSHIDNRDRSVDFLGHSGQRIGGNDLDIALSMAAFMPHLGLGSLMNNKLPVPSKPFWNAVAVNDISAQREFVTLNSKRLIEDLIKDAQQPALIKRLLKVQKEQLGYQLVRSAEQSKIALSSDSSVDTPLGYIDTGLHANVTEADFESAITMPLSKVESLMREALEASGVKPDRIYVTGGTARSPAIYKRISGLFPEIPIVVGDHFGSVTAGLTRWAQRVFA
ncbi:molecular chaperone [Shewanella youngdeokensis]|uniref:Molecular chaperone n=1 Tax=Shewanella youngdeokensis TaxID=2999068 RepID=A0ABZ0K3X7_9GAMM|nr:molecular chaperone [Shewanella sp. DAU334]